MSLTFITQHSENIYNIVVTKTEESVKPEKYVSRSRTRIVPEKPDAECIEPNTFILTSTRKHLHKTMGHAEIPLHAPDDFMKKNGGVKWRRKTDHKCIHRDLPPLPEIDLCAKKPEREQRNFKMKNIKDVICRERQRPNPKYAITRTGDVRVLCESGIMPAYIFHPNYGKVPKYLIDSKKAEAEALEKARKEREKIIGFRLISPEERLQLLTGLKTNWQELQKKFQLLPVLTDTHPKKKRKRDIQNELTKLENDILLVESNPLIYVCDGEAECRDDGLRLVPKKVPYGANLSTEHCLRR